jgi:hypothetical protein
MNQENTNDCELVSSFANYGEIGRGWTANGLAAGGAVASIALAEAVFGSFQASVQLWGFGGSVLAGVALGAAAYYIEGRRLGRRASELKPTGERNRATRMIAQPV